jgi:hypothetical protein
MRYWIQTPIKTKQKPLGKLKSYSKNGPSSPKEGRKKKTRKKENKMAYLSINISKIIWNISDYMCHLNDRDRHGRNSFLYMVSYKKLFHIQ